MVIRSRALRSGVTLNLGHAAHLRPPCPRPGRRTGLRASLPSRLALRWQQVVALGWRLREGQRGLFDLLVRGGQAAFMLAQVFLPGRDTEQLHEPVRVLPVAGPPAAAGSPAPGWSRWVMAPPAGRCRGGVTLCDPVVHGLEVAQGALGRTICRTIMETRRPVRQEGRRQLVMASDSSSARRSMRHTSPWALGCPSWRACASQGRPTRAARAGESRPGRGCRLPRGRAWDSPTERRLSVSGRLRHADAMFEGEPLITFWVLCVSCSGVSVDAVRVVEAGR